MPEIQIPPSGASRPAYYVTAVDALYYAHYFHPVPGGRGWSKALMEENLPGWTLNDFMHLLRRHRLFVSTSFYGYAWRWPDVVGVVIEGDTLIKDEGNLEHPAKEAARRRIAVGSTGPTMRHVDGGEPSERVGGGRAVALQLCRARAPEQPWSPPGGRHRHRRT